jgi:hypothetical protein
MRSSISPNRDPTAASAVIGTSKPSKGRASMQALIKVIASLILAAGISKINSSWTCNKGRSHGRSVRPVMIRPSASFKISAAVPCIGVFSAQRSANDFFPQSADVISGR